MKVEKQGKACRDMKQLHSVSATGRIYGFTTSIGWTISPFRFKAINHVQRYNAMKPTQMNL